MIFAPNRHECVTVVIKNASAPFHCVLFCLVLIFEVERLPDKTYRLFSFNDRRDDR